MHACAVAVTHHFGFMAQFSGKYMCYDGNTQLHQHHIILMQINFEQSSAVGKNADIGVD